MASEKIKQEDKIVSYMNEFGGITALQAMADLGVMRLASRISDLRRRGVRCHVKRYYLADLEEKRNEA